LRSADFPVEVFERRPDPRKAGFLGGRSINLALADAAGTG
jgi:kynurenine 3-monooxygenase